MRKNLLYILYSLSGIKIPQNMKTISSIDKLSFAEKKNYQLQQIEKLLLHSYEKVPYYRKILREVGVVKNNKVFIENFHKIPVLTKEKIIEIGWNIYSKDHKKRKSYTNISGGTTGEPVRLVQDKKYREWGSASLKYMFESLGKEIGEAEIMLWGSYRDIIKGHINLRSRIYNKIIRKHFFNSYNFTKENMMKLVLIHNKIKPTVYWTYVDSIYEFSKFVLQEDIDLFPPRFIVTTIGPLYSDQRDIIQQAFKCRVLNQYGSREVGLISYEDNPNSEMKVCFYNNLVELISLDGSSDEKRIIVTNLNNYSMPLIRYDIGDIGIQGQKFFQFNDLRSYFTIKNVVGRTLGFFKKNDGTLIHTHYMIEQLFYKDWIKQFQIVQKDYDSIVFRIVLNNEPKKKDLEKIKRETRFLMGEECKISFAFVDEIKPTQSGKYIYTKCEI